MKQYLKVLTKDIKFQTKVILINNNNNNNNKVIKNLHPVIMINNYKINSSSKWSHIIINLKFSLIMKVKHWCLRLKNSNSGIIQKLNLNFLNSRKIVILISSICIKIISFIKISKKKHYNSMSKCLLKLNKLI